MNRLKQVWCTATRLAGHMISRPAMVVALWGLGGLAGLAAFAGSLQAPLAQARANNSGQANSRPATNASAPAYRDVPTGSFTSLLPPSEQQSIVKMPAFKLRVMPVTQAEYAGFVRREAQWRRSHVSAGVLADALYLQSWVNDLQPFAGPAKQQQLQQPVTQVSWFAAQAFCESEGARLPTWHEWEYAAAADERRRDARTDAVWRNRILAWYGQTSKALPSVGGQLPNVYGIHDLHGLIWEWVDDIGALMVSGDNRNQGDPDIARFCGAGAISANDRANYPVLMRMAMLSSLKAVDTNRNLGFRCAKSLATRPATPSRKKP